MKKADCSFTVLLLSVLLSGCCATVKQAVRVNSESNQKLAKAAYASNMVDELKKEIVMNYASLRCIKDVFDHESLAGRDSAACACQRLGAIDFSQCEIWMNRQ